VLSIQDSGHFAALEWNFRGPSYQCFSYGSCRSKCSSNLLLQHSPLAWLAWLSTPHSNKDPNDSPHPRTQSDKSLCPYPPSLTPLLLVKNAHIAQVYPLSLTGFFSPSAIPVLSIEARTPCPDELFTSLASTTPRLEAAVATPQSSGQALNWTCLAALRRTASHYGNSIGEGKMMRLLVVIIS